MTPHRRTVRVVIRNVAPQASGERAAPRRQQPDGCAPGAVALVRSKAESWAAQASFQLMTDKPDPLVSINPVLAGGSHVPNVEEYTS